MKKTLLYCAFAVTVCGCLYSCGGKDNTASKDAQEEYQKSLNDSIDIIKSEIDSCNEQISLLRDTVNVWLRDFRTVAKAREVAPYIIMADAAASYPLNSTGIIARINDSNQFELIAALSGNSFNQISLVAGDQSVVSDKVNKDQALNYEAANLTTVMFTGSAADSIGNFIADNQLNPISLTYLNSGKPIISMKLSEKEKKVISYTYLLYHTTNELHRLENRVPMLNEKINLIRIHQEKKNKAAE